MFTVQCDGVHTGYGIRVGQLLYTTVCCLAKHVAVCLLNHFCNSNEAYTFVGHTVTIIHSRSSRKRCNRGCVSFRTCLAAGIHALRGSRTPLWQSIGSTLCYSKHICILTSVFMDHILLQFCLRHRLRGPNKRYTVAS